MKTKLKQFLASAFLALLAVLGAHAQHVTEQQREQDANLVRAERELSRLRRENPNDAEIARRHDQASRAALQRARERVGLDPAEGRGGLVRVAATTASTPRIGFVGSTGGPTLEAFRQGMRNEGYVEGKDFVLELRFTEGRQERFPALVDELLRLRVDVLLAGSPTGAIAALRADTTTPIVIAGVTDPHGLAKALGRPFDHVTGTSVAMREAGGPWVELLKQASPGLTRVAVLSNPAHRSRDRWLGDIRAAAQRLGVAIEVHEAVDSASLDATIAAITASGAQGLIVTGEPIFLIERAKLISLARDCLMPAVYFSKIFADSGGLLAYGGSLEDSYRMAPRYIARILKGAKPSELPVEDARVELVVNKRAASILGISIPEELVRRADKVIE